MYCFHRSIHRRGVPSPRFFPWSLIPGPFWGAVPQSQVFFHWSLVPGPFPEWYPSPRFFSWSLVPCPFKRAHQLGLGVTHRDSTEIIVATSPSVPIDLSRASPREKSCKLLVFTSHFTEFFFRQKETPYKVNFQKSSTSVSYPEKIICKI